MRASQEIQTKFNLWQEGLWQDLGRAHKKLCRETPCSLETQG